MNLLAVLSGCFEGIFPEKVFGVHVASVVRKGLVDCIVVCGDG